MAATLDEEFQDIAREYYPGSHHQIVRDGKNPTVLHPSKSGVDPLWDANPRTYLIAGVVQEFFTISHLAKALGRRPGTLRLWEREGVIPKATYQINSDRQEGRRRLYTRDQIEGLVKIAHEEGILVSRERLIRGTKFTARALELFQDLAASTQGST